MKNTPTGKSIICTDNKNLKKLVGEIKNKNILTYGENSNANYKISNVRYKNDFSIFDISFKDLKKKNKKIKNLFKTFRKTQRIKRNSSYCHMFKSL